MIPLVRTIKLSSQLMFGKILKYVGSNILSISNSLVSPYLFYCDDFSKHRNIMSISFKIPSIGKKAFIAENCSILGDVFISDHASIWFNAVIKGDPNSVR